MEEDQKIPTEEVLTTERVSFLQKVKNYFFAIPKNKRYSALAVFVLAIIVYTMLFTTPREFPRDTVIHIESGSSLQSIALYLEESRIIRSPFIFRTLVIFLGGEKNIIAGNYLVDSKSSPLQLAQRFIKGDFGLEDKKITIPEGWSVYQIAEYLEKILVDFDKDSFIKLAKDKEGYLFPDTYFVPAVSKPEQIVGLMSSNFYEKIKSISGIATSTRSLDEILTMASILEGETKVGEDRRIVSGILWKRLSISMPLQVDATFQYINGKNTYELSLNDLQIDSPYNTYKYKGLPPTPINNPGLDSILSAMNPTKTNYIYFLSSRDGKMYYASTFEGHQVNRAKYLNK